MRRLAWVAVAWALLLSLCKPSAAHEVAPAVLTLEQVSTGQFLVRWSPPLPAPPDLAVHFPKQCLLNGQSTFDAQSAPVIATLMDCGEAGLVGEISLSSHTSNLGAFGVNVEWLDHSQTMRLSHASPPSVAFGSAGNASGALQALGQYVVLGLEHILLGVDHLLFLLGLMLLVRGWRSLVVTISAFTLAHSVTLTAASLEWVHIPTAPVELGIALSVLLLGVEAAAPNPAALSRRFPWLVAFAFGLLHGFGFASALSEVGLPPQAVVWSLLGFNLGVELGQLCVVALVVLAFQPLKAHDRARRRVEWCTVGVLVSASTFWVLERAETWLLAFS